MVKWSNHRDLEAVSSLKCQVLSWRTRVESFGSSYLILSGERRPLKANRAKRTQFFDCGLRILDCGFRKACGPPPECAQPGCTNKPNWAEPIMRNKPNSAGRPGPRRAKRAKRSQLPEAGHRGGVSIADCGLRIEDGPAAERPLRPAASGLRGPVVQTNPIGRSQHAKRTQFSGVKCAKRTQFRPGVQTSVGRMRETKPICVRQSTKPGGRERWG